MAELITMPKLGFNMSEGRLVKWYKQEEERVEKGENLFSVETDKTNIDIGSTESGIVRKLFIQEGDKLPVFLPIAIIAEANENIDEMIKEAYAQLKDAAIAFPEKGPEKGKTFGTTPEKPRQDMAIPGGKLHISPRAKQVANAKGIPLEKFICVEGTGFQGGVCERDVMDYAQKSTNIRATPLARSVAKAQGVELEQVAGSGVGEKIMKKDVMNTLAVSGKAGYTPDGKQILDTTPYTGIRKIIGDKLSASAQISPHVYFTHTINMEKLLELRSEINRIRKQKISITDYIARAAILALKKYPDMNAALVEETIERYKTVNLGIAVAAPSGLIVPVIKNADEMNIAELSIAGKVLTERAREGKLIPEEYSGGTFTISNLGMFGIENFTAVINPPEAAILAVGATTDQVVVVSKGDGSKEIAIKPVMSITLSVDHKLIDGLLATQFLAETKRLLENPICMLV